MSDEYRGRVMNIISSLAKILEQAVQAATLSLCNCHDLFPAIRIEDHNMHTPQIVEMLSVLTNQDASTGKIESWSRP